MASQNGNGDHAGNSIENNGFLVIAYYKDSPIRPTYHHFDIADGSELDPEAIFEQFNANPNLFNLELYSLNLIDRWQKEPE